ncbi:MAG: hypothetical protein KatS3mg115_1324 [Candidatus Poribacteria bacterium]|nr:MAG: hypothetical protein KatS3mg115_1324 [Candidatus Poribacteria bacterium]
MTRWERNGQLSGRQPFWWRWGRSGSPPASGRSNRRRKFGGSPWWTRSGVFDEYEKAKQATQELQRASQRLDEQAQALQKEIQSLQERLIKQRLFIEDESQLHQMERDILAKQQELDRLLREGQQALQERYDELSEPLLQEIREIIHQIGQRDGYDLILEKQYIVLYHRPTMDLTDEVIRMLNERAKSAPQSAPETQPAGSQ